MGEGRQGGVGAGHVEIHVPSASLSSFRFVDVTAVGKGSWEAPIAHFHRTARV